MTKTFKEVSKVETVDFCSLAAGDCFYFNKTYYMKLLITEDEFDDDDDCCYNSIDLESGVLTYFLSDTKVKPYKNCEVILYE